MFEHGATIDLTLRDHERPADQLRLSAFVVRRSDGRWSQLCDIGAAVGRDPASAAATDLSAAERQVIANEFQAGILAGRRKVTDADCGLHIELQVLGASIGSSNDLAALPSIAIAVAGSLLVLHGAGVEDLETEPHGGHGWQLERFVVC